MYHIPKKEKNKDKKLITYVIFLLETCQILNIDSSSFVQKLHPYPNLFKSYIHIQIFICYVTYLTASYKM
jgi:hypothetical protein